MVAARFAAMGTDAHVIVVGGMRADIAFARTEIARFERLWSRFLPESEISAVNAAAGRPVRVSGETLSLVRLALEGRDATGGLFDPTVLGSMLALGYDRTFAELHRAVPHRGIVPIPSAAGLPVDVDSEAGTVSVDGGLDMGGIGKGYAADLVVAALMDNPSVRGACVNIGGDLRVAGDGPGGEPWMIDVEHPSNGGSLGRIALESGAVATTSRIRRRWTKDGSVHHHVVDPRTGLPAETGLASVTVVAGDAWWAEVVAKAAFLAGTTQVGRVLRDAGVEGVAVDDDGAVLALDGEPLLVA